jgi:hypothetical protein
MSSLVIDREPFIFQLPATSVLRVPMFPPAERAQG